MKKDVAATLYCDGASKGNPGHAGIGVVLLIDHQKITISEYIGITTNNLAEYTALLKGLKEALKNGATSINIYTDSELMVKQITGNYKVRSPNLEKSFREIISLLTKFNHYLIKHISRDLNKEADRLATSAIKTYLNHNDFK
ncbi:MAG: ribonuclease HI family protein [Thermodesulfovibrionales bacterium]|nr:ribonuclease HI family protein [Thermodesulfovibrionales bacterium]